ncbi:MAG: hypothetical protein WC244_02460 [Patescibacteria group bacterium]|jgi:hypothetical protein
MGKIKKVLVPILVVLIIVVGVGSFYGGMLYGKSQGNRLGQQRFPQMGGGATTGINKKAGAQNIGFVNGEILSNDGKTMTVKINTGGSKIILLSDATEIGKMASGTASDLISGQNVMVNGKTNTDGSITASSVQIRPVGQGLGGPAGQSPDAGNPPAQPAQ